MRNLFFSPLILPMALLLSVAALAQSGKPSTDTDSKTGQGENAAAPPKSLAGTWAIRTPRGAGFSWYNYALMADEPPMTAWAEAKFKENKPSFGPNQQEESNDPTYSCVPNSVPRVYAAVQAAMQIVEVPGRTIMFFGRNVRQIYTDGRQHPPGQQSLWMGHSIAKWDGDTFVVDTVDLNDRNWLDRMGHPHSNKLHVIERVKRVDYNTMLLDVTIDDPIAYTKTWNATQRTFRLRTNDRAVEAICEDIFINEAFGLKPKLPSMK